MNIPIVTTTGVGLNKVIEDRNAGHIVESNVNDLESGLIHICDDLVRKNMIGNGRKIILENHIWERIVDDLIAKLLNQQL